MWQLDPQQRTASLTSDLLAARVSIGQPELGVCDITWRTQKFSAQLLGVVFCDFRERSPLDCYARGTDIVITYNDPPQQKNVRPQVYWRFVNEDRIAAQGFELVLSIETDLLDSDPQVRVESVLPGSSVFARTASGWESIRGSSMRLHASAYAPLIVFQGDTWLYAEMIYPSDFTESTIEHTANGWRTTWDLFPEHLEKGVIRRARMRGVFLVGDDLSKALTAFEHFQASPLPLTT